MQHVSSDPLIFGNLGFNFLILWHNLGFFFGVFDLKATCYSRRQLKHELPEMGGLRIHMLHNKKVL